MNADIVEAVIEYLEGAMGASLGATPSNPAVYSDFAPDQSYPYCVVMDPDETYTFESSGIGDGGYPTAVITQGTLNIIFLTEGPGGKVQARALARQCARLLCDTVVALNPADGPVLEFRPLRAGSIPVTEVGPGQPTVFKRVVTIGYRQEYAQ